MLAAFRLLDARTRGREGPRQGHGDPDEAGAEFAAAFFVGEEGHDEVASGCVRDRR
ncbi:hypothetical protein BH10ACT9_BH10ACT9_31670 [soil metagenome]